MSRTGWKQSERDAADLFDAVRFPANTGARVDYEGAQFIGQDKQVARASLAQIETLAEEAEALGGQCDKLGVVTIKRSAGAGRKTPRLVVMTEAVWRRLRRVWGR